MTAFSDMTNIVADDGANAPAPGAISRPEAQPMDAHVHASAEHLDGLLVRVGTGRYVIPLAAVEECLELSREEDLRSRGRSLIALRDRLVPFIRLRELFATGTEPDAYQKIVVVTTGAERIGLAVDQIIANHQSIIGALPPLHRDVATFTGATILDDGRVALILDVARLVALGQNEEERLAAAG